MNKSFNDTVLGGKGTVLKYLRNYDPSPAAKKKYLVLAQEEVVLVQVKVTASTKYYLGIGPTSFYLVGKEGIDKPATSILDSEIKAAGYPPLVRAGTGETKTGWVVFTPEKGLAKLTVRYERLATRTSDGKTIPAKNFDIVLG